jgi:hypothetical protein
MAIRDHTARTRPFVPPDGTLAVSPGDPSSSGAVWPETLRLSTLDDIALAVFALTRLRYDSERYRKAQAWGLPVKPVEWPLSIAVTASLATAIHCLRQYAGLLGHEPPVNA